METSDFLSSAPPDRVLFVCWLPRADLFDLKDGDYLQVSRLVSGFPPRSHPWAELVRPSADRIADNYEEEDP